jgi:hypothetical protein
VILAAHDRSSQHALGRIVVERDARVVEKPGEPRPPFEHVADSLAQFAARQADLLHRPRLDALGNRPRPLLPQLVPEGLCRGVAGKPTGDEPLDGIEVPNQLVDLAAGRRPVRRVRLEFPLRVRPAVREREAGAVARQALVHRVAVDDNRAAVVAEDLASLLRRFPGEDAIERRRGCGHAPHGARRQGRRAEPGPPGFVDMDHGRGERLATQRLVRGLEMPRQRLNLIPERLRLDDQPLARHHPHLALQRQMIGVFRDGHADGKRGRVPTAGDQRGRGGRRDHGAVARAPILLSGVMLDVIRRLHRGDALGRFALACQLGERPAAGRTAALIRGQLVAHLDKPARRAARAARGPAAAGAPWAARPPTARRESRCASAAGSARPPT